MREIKRGRVLEEHSSWWDVLCASLGHTKHALPIRVCIPRNDKNTFSPRSNIKPRHSDTYSNKKKSQTFQMTALWTSAAIWNRFSSSTAHSQASLIWFKSNTYSQYLQSSLTSDSRILGRVEYKNIFCLGKLDIQTKLISTPIQMYYTQHSADKQLLSKINNIWALFAWLSYSD